MVQGSKEVFRRHLVESMRLKSEELIPENERPVTWAYPEHWRPPQCIAGYFPEIPMYFIPAVIMAFEAILIALVALDRYAGVRVHEYGVLLLLGGACWTMYLGLVRPIR